MTHAAAIPINLPLEQRVNRLEIANDDQSTKLERISQVQDEHTRDLRILKQGQAEQAIRHHVLEDRFDRLEIRMDTRFDHLEDLIRTAMGMEPRASQGN